MGLWLWEDYQEISYESEKKEFPSTLFLLMDYTILIDTIRMELSILYFKGLSVKSSIKWCISVHEDWFISANSADPDEMPPYAAFHLGLHCLSKYLFTGIQNEKSYTLAWGCRSYTFIYISLSNGSPVFQLIKIIWTTLVEGQEKTICTKLFWNLW